MELLSKTAGWLCYSKIRQHVNIGKRCLIGVNGLIVKTAHFSWPAELIQHFFASYVAQDSRSHLDSETMYD